MSLFASHDAVLGQAAGGTDSKVTLYECRPILSGFPGCMPFPVFQQKRVWTDAGMAGEMGDLGLFDRSANYDVLQITCDVGSAAATTPWIGLYAEGIDIGVFGFTLRVDDGHAEQCRSRPRWRWRVPR
jgi:hypothetical protein